MNKLSYRNRMLIGYCVSMVGLSLLNLIVGVVPTTMSDNNLNMMFTLLSQILCMGIIPLCFSIAFRPVRGIPDLRQMVRDYHYRQPYNPKVWIFVLPLCISFYLVTQLMGRLTVLLLTLLQFTFTVNPATIYTGPLDLVKWIALGSLLPAVFEEFTHRGVAMDALKGRGNEMSMVLLSSLLFAAMHTNIIQFFFAFGGGLIMGFLVIKTGSIYPAMLLHFANNTFSHMESYASQHPDSVLGFLEKINAFYSNSIVGLVVSFVVMIAAAFLTIFLLMCIQRYCGRPEGLRERGLRLGKQKEGKYQWAITLDTYRPYGKPTLADNIPLIAVLVVTLTMTVFTYVWGVLR